MFDLKYTTQISINMHTRVSINLYIFKRKQLFNRYWFGSLVQTICNNVNLTIESINYCIFGCTVNAYFEPLSVDPSKIRFVYIIAVEITHWLIFFVLLTENLQLNTHTERTQTDWDQHKYELVSVDWTHGIFEKCKLFLLFNWYEQKKHTRLLVSTP